MHNVTHSLAHRAPPASRTRGRWQPYAAITSSSSSASSSSTSSSSSSARNSPVSYLYTPATSVSNSPPQKTPACDIDACRSQAFTSNPLKEALPRDGNRTKFALGLVDQSVKTLCDIWRPQDIPAVFNCPKQGLGVADGLSSKLQSQRLSNACSTSPILAHSLLTTKSLPSIPTAPALLQTGTSEVRNYLIPVRGFVHEVLRRSRTSGGVLQTALCYLEAVRPKLHDLIREENLGIGMRGEPEPTSSITPATDAELEMEAELSRSEAEADTVLMCTQPAEDMLDTVRIADDEVPSNDWNCSDPPQLICETSIPLKSPVPTSPLEGPLLPSPLLCPRRTFLAALILASKFTQDKCYSNRAWAKLSGLPPREIGRCERALGNALEWRLWVGKAAAPAVPTAGQSTQANKPVSRSQSEPNLATMVSSSCMPRTDQSTDAVISPPLPPHSQIIKSLRRSSTLPSEAFASTKVSTDSMEVSDSWSSPFAGRMETNQSPLSDVPGLSYSPSSTESSLSSGERTIQMSTFLEDNMAPPTSESIQSWPWLEADSNDIIDNNSSPVAKINGKLLTGNGLSGFQSKKMLWNMTGSLGKLNEQSAAPPPPHRFDNIHIYDPSVALAIGNTEVSYAT